MEKIMFDCCSVDKVFEHFEVFEKSLDRFEYYITEVQIDQLSNIPDSKKEKRANNFIMLAVLRVKLVPVSVVPAGITRAGMAPIGDSTIYRQLTNDKLVNEKDAKDAVIAATAIHEGCLLITEDIGLTKKMKRLNYEVMSFDEFFQIISQ